MIDSDVPSLTDSPHNSFRCLVCFGYSRRIRSATGSIREQAKAEWKLHLAARAGGVR